MITALCSAILVRGIFVAVIVFVAVLPYCAARWLIHHDTVYYQLADAGRFGRLITDTAEMINVFTPFPFAVFGLIVGITLIFTLKCFRVTATAES